MKKSRLLISIGLIAIASLISGNVIPWWFPGIVSFACGFWFIRRGYTSYITAFLTSGLTWITLAFYHDYEAEVSIAKLLSSIFNNIGMVPIYIITGLSIAFVCGFWALSGNFLYKILFRYRRPTHTTK